MSIKPKEGTLGAVRGVSKVLEPKPYHSKKRGMTPL